jgi:hypothetical protein
MTARDPLILEVAAAIGAGRIAVGPIHMDGAIVHGVCWPDGAIRINPAPSVCDTAIHECLHRLRPSWSEQTVRRRTTQIMRQLTDAEVDKLYELVLVTAYKTQKAATE